MGRGLRWLLALGACYAPHPPAGAPCDDMHPCPTGQTCIAGTCNGMIDGQTTDAGIDGLMPGPDDMDGDGVKDGDDNCPSTPNGNQGDEDNDQLGDACDPCPIDSATTDTDSDGVGDACDPRPSTAGDTIVLFEGFHTGVPSSWQTIGSTMQMGDDIVLVGVANNHTALIPPLAAPAQGTISMKGSLNALYGGADVWLSIVTAYDPAQDSGIFCEIWAPSATGTMGRDIDIYDTVSNMTRGVKLYAWQTNTPYTLTFRRASASYTCAMSPGDQVSGMTNNAPGTKFAVHAFATTATVSWLMVVTQ